MQRHSRPERERPERASQETMGWLLSKKSKLKHVNNAMRCHLDAADRQPMHRAPRGEGGEEADLRSG